MKKNLLLIALAFIGFSSFSQIIYVNQLASGANNGTSWSNAYTNLTIALSNATTNSTIWIAAGTYKPHLSSRSDNYNLNLSGLKIYGGFAGNESSLNQRVFGSNETILSGDVLGNDSGTPAYSNSTYNDNSYHVINVGTAGNNFTLDGLTITGGFSNGSATGFLADGSGIYIADNIAKFTLQNCKITKNVCRQGGALSAPSLQGSNDTITINACEFSENVAGYGSGLYISLNTAGRTINISNCLFAKNKATNTSGTNGYAGSSIWIAGYGTGSSISTNITNCTFAKNSDDGTYAGMANTNRSTVVLSRAFSGSPHSVTINNSIFWDNTNPGGVAPAVSKANDNIIASSLLLIHNIDENNFSGLSQSTGSTGNNNSDPLFVNSTGGNYQLSSGSPAINTGDNNSVVGFIDLFNNQRIFNTTVDRGAIEFDSTPTNIGEPNALNNVTIYPNPTNSVINIQCDENVKAVFVYNTLGALVQTENQVTFTIAELPTGIYFITIQTENNSITKRIVKQ
ncbi:MAG: T9SS type A sorting domain-containing protein [Bacteroidia bacterium]|nr:T9SS type A sorting domain-containing protein [Bacteroidia bacterium]